MNKKTLRLPYSGDQWKRNAPFLSSLMCFPNSSVKRDAYILAYEIGHKLQSRPEENICLTPYQTKTLLNSPSHKELSEEANANLKKGTVAGDILLKLYTLCKLEPEIASINRVYHWMESTYKETSKMGNISVKSKGTFTGVWKQYKSVAHLHAAQEYFCIVSDTAHMESSYEDFLFFLATAENMRNFMLSYKPLHTKEGKQLITGDDSWEIEHSFELPLANFVVPTVNQKQMDAIKSYEAPVPQQ